MDMVTPEPGIISDSPKIFGVLIETSTFNKESLVMTGFTFWIIRES